MAIDPDDIHEIRMRVGANSLRMNDALDEAGVEAMREASRAVGVFVDLMIDREVPAANVLGMVLGMGTEALVAEWRSE